MATIRLASPDLGDEENAAIARVLASGMLVQGAEVERFERALAARCGRAHAVAVSSGTAALELALRALGVDGGEVIVPALTWPSPAHAAALVGATPALIDVDEATWNGDARSFAAARGPRTRAAIAIDQFGVPADHAAIAAALPGVPIVEDAACAIGSLLRGAPCGSFGVIACLSFHPRKVVTTGEGGACLTDDARLAETLRILRNHGQRSAGVFSVPAPNLRLTEMQGAMGTEQLAKLDAIVRARRGLAEQYRARLAGTGIGMQATPEGASRNEQTFGVVLPGAIDEATRDRVIARMREAGVESGRLSYALHRIPSLASARCPGRAGDGTFPVSERLVDRGLALPLHGRMSGADVERVVETLLVAARSEGALA